MKTFLVGFGFGVACVFWTQAIFGNSIATLVVSLIGMASMIAGVCLND